ncbi:MAG: hypothetical protein N3I86_09225 [Verrucomicrobiae bacterium]|nr:hypothetical protein [Verrucomicrobiae bacterium]
MSTLVSAAAAGTAVAAGPAAAFAPDADPLKPAAPALAKQNSPMNFPIFRLMNINQRLQTAPKGKHTRDVKSHRSRQGFRNGRSGQKNLNQEVTEGARGRLATRTMKRQLGDISGGASETAVSVRATVAQAGIGAGAPAAISGANVRPVVERFSALKRPASI